MSVHDLNLARLERENDNTKVSVEELLRLILSHIEKGEFKNAKRCFVCIVDEGEGEHSAWTLEGYRCGMQRHEEIGLIETFKIQQLKRWFTNGEGL